MTRKDYVILAGAIAGISNPNERANMAKVVADVCEEDNERFQRETFYRVCQVPYDREEK